MISYTYNQVRFERLIKDSLNWGFERLSKEFYLEEEKPKNAPKKSIFGFCDTSSPSLERGRQKTGFKSSLLHPGIIPAQDLERTLTHLGYSLTGKVAP